MPVTLIQPFYFGCLLFSLGMLNRRFGRLLLRISPQIIHRILWRNRIQPILSNRLPRNQKTHEKGKLAFWCSSSYWEFHKLKIILSWRFLAWCENSCRWCVWGLLWVLFLFLNSDLWCFINEESSLTFFFAFFFYPGDGRTECIVGDFSSF